LGIWGRVFKLKNPAKVLAVLSSSTVFREKTFSRAQKEKFLTNLAGSGKIDTGTWFADWYARYYGKLYRQVEPKRYEPLQSPPDMSCISGKTIPIGGGRAIHMPIPTREAVDIAYQQSWAGLPDVVIDYLDRSDRLDHIPLGLRTSYDGFSFKGDKFVGRISVIQEPELKARTVANPNRVAQAYTVPLGRAWYHVLRNLPTDCTFDQLKGIRWVQRKLAKGQSLSGSDLSAASDLLALGACIQCAKIMTPTLVQDWDYDQDIKYFLNLSRGDWYTPWDRRSVRWEQGQPLGLYPSFALLGMTNNHIGFMSAVNAGLDPSDSFRVIGDDIIMDSRMQVHYNNFVHMFGGEINLSKTITSDRIAEFAGRIIEPHRFYLKTVRFFDPSDNSFMEAISGLGPQAVSILRPRQRRPGKPLNGFQESLSTVPGPRIPSAYPWRRGTLGISIPRVLLMRDLNQTRDWIALI